MTMITLTTGTAFIMWLGEQITERGIGNGISLIIFASIVTGIPERRRQLLARRTSGDDPAAQPDRRRARSCCRSAIAIVVFFERAQRRIPIHYSRRQVGRRVYGGQTAHLPLKVNMAGMIPPIFASSLLMFPATLASMNIPGMAGASATLLNRGDWLFHTLSTSR